MSKQQARDELEQAMDWMSACLHDMLTARELDAPLLHLIDAAHQVDVVILAGEGASEMLHTARALVVVRAPVICGLAVESWASEITPEAARRDPFIRAWLRKKQRGEDAPVHALPPDYRFELLTLAGESSAGRMCDRYWRIAGQCPQRTLVPYVPACKTQMRAPCPIHPLFVEPIARREGLDTARLREDAGSYLERSHRFEALFDRDRDGIP
jgi:hypothetical protein